LWKPDAFSNPKAFSLRRRLEGPVWATAQFPEAWNDANRREKLLEFLPFIEDEASLVGASARAMVITRRSD
jgi:hypothetical protein